MPEPEAARTVRVFKAQLLRQDAVAARELVNAYGPIFRNLQEDIRSLLASVRDQQLSFAQVKRLERLNALSSQVEREVTKFSKFADRTITRSQADAVSLAQQATKATVDAALPAGVTDSVLADAGISWNQLPSSAFENFIGISGDGKPLANLLAPLPNQARQGIIDGIGEGIARGFNPRKTAAIMRRKFGIPLDRALRISRTETLRSFREATRVQYEENRDIVKGYRRIAKLDSLTCFACIALDGKLYKTSTLLDEHVNGRCAMVPVTIGYKDLGIDLPEDTRMREVGVDWFPKQPEAMQRAMMGPGKFKAWKEGKFALGDMAKPVPSRIWGVQSVEKPLRELVA